ncbi:MAG: penicillin-binding protein 2 [Candidatus Nealsonbacteria bacterium]|nr:penicillin-binding protein 2 [Candidatus Nealsonbacteria bacterium]
MKRKTWFREKYAVKRTGQELEPQEVLLDRFAQKREKELGIKEMKFEVPPSRKILWGFLVFSLISLSLLWLKTFQLTVINGPALAETAFRNVTRLTPLRADRGIIYDRNSQKLVSNLPSFDLMVDKRDLPQDENQKKREIDAVAGYIKKDPVLLQKEIEDSKAEAVIVEANLDHETLVILETKLNDLAGFQIEQNTVRSYPDGPLFSQILGYNGRINPQEFQALKNDDYFISDYIGKQGLEKSYEEILRGKPGVFEVKKDATGQKSRGEVKSQPEAGQSLVLWLDADLQKKLQTELGRIINEIGSRKGAAIALDPKTGGVLALVSWPSFDNNLFSQGISIENLQKILADPNQPFFNRAAAGQYASGSTIKPLIAAAALQEKTISPEKQILDQGFIEVKNQYNPEITYVFRGLEPHGWVDLRKALAVSSNIYFYTVGGGYQNQIGLGSTRIKKYLELFGWGKKTGIDLPGETSGLIPDHHWKEENVGESWYVGDTYNLSIGQGYLQISPLQEAVAFAALANGGRLLRPQMVQKIVAGSPASASPRIVQEFSPELIRQLPIDEKNIKTVLAGMRDAVVYGSASTLNSLPVRVAAKTGTAQTPRKDYYHNWVTVLAPLDDPQIVLTVMIEDVPGVRAAVLPVAKETLEWYFTR